jgi:hypothetical protein
MVSYSNNKTKKILLIGIPVILILIAIIYILLFPSSNKSASIPKALYNNKYKIELLLSMEKEEIDKIFGENYLNSESNTENVYNYTEQELTIMYINNKANTIMVNMDFKNETNGDWYGYYGIHTGTTLNEIIDLVGEENVISPLLVVLFFDKNYNILTSQDGARYRMSLFLENDIVYGIMLSYNA